MYKRHIKIHTMIAQLSVDDPQGLRLCFKFKIWKNKDLKIWKK